MKKIPLSDGSGRWFDVDSAKCWEERVESREQEWRDHHDPQKESLYLTSHGNFVLYQWHWSMDAGLYFSIDAEKAIDG